MMNFIYKHIISQSDLVDLIVIGSLLSLIFIL
jgi:hypothetical protein